MTNTIDNFGKNAGKIWNTLCSYGPLTEEDLIKKTKLNEYDFHAAIGWLARENKVSKKGTTYELSETNLTSYIGENAGKIWDLLCSQGDCDVSSISKTTKIRVKDAYSALGWLAREDKIRTATINTKNKTIISVGY